MSMNVAKKYLWGVGVYNVSADLSQINFPYHTLQSVIRPSIAS
jgi:hypothetical protein